MQEMYIFSCNSIITTEKDLVKLFKFENIFEQEQINLFVLEIDIEILEGEDYLLNTIMELINK
jgi:tetraacyldisaccharide-1-P 4'-kinase